jgi:hypothetical protein
MRGPKVVGQYKYEGVDEFRIADYAAELLHAERGNLAPDASFVILVDSGGLGRSTYKMLTEKHGIRNCYGIDAAESPSRDSEFHRMRDELWWEVREALMDSKELAIDPHLKTFDDLLSQLTSIKWAAVELNGRTRTKVQGKGSSSGIPNVKPLLHSPNEADSLCLAWRGYLRYCSKVPGRFKRVGRYQRSHELSWKIL